MAVLAHLIPALLVGVVSCLVLQGLPAVQGRDEVSQLMTEQELADEKLLVTEREQDDDQFMTDEEQDKEQSIMEQEQDEEQSIMEQEKDEEQFVTEEEQEEAGVVMNKKRKREPTPRQKADERLKEIEKSKEEKKRLMERHLPIDYEINSEKKTNIMKIAQDGFVILYSTRRQTPIFVAERLDGYIFNRWQNNEAERLKSKPVRSKNSKFRRDPVVPRKMSSTYKAYRESVYVSGHHAAAADMTDSQQQINSFVMSNMAPQHVLHNQAWKSWEHYAREKKSVNKKIVFVITGTTKSLTGNKIKDGTVVPREWYKLLFWCQGGEMQAEYIMTNHLNKTLKDLNNEWASTENGIKRKWPPLLKATHTSLKEIVKFFNKRVKIHFKLDHSLCAIDPVTSSMGKLAKLYAEQAKVEKRDASPASIGAVCNKVKDKIRDLAKMGKVTLSNSQTSKGCPNSPAKKKMKNPKGEKSILDLTEGSFSGVCKKKAAELMYAEDIEEDMNNNYNGDQYSEEMSENYIDSEDNFDEYADSEDDIDEYGVHEEGKNEKLTAIVTKGQSLKLLDLLPIPKKIDLSKLSAINVKLQKVVADCDKKQIDVYSATLPGFKFVPNVFELSKVSFAIRINYGDEKHVIAALAGRWVLGSLHLNTLARFDSKTTSLLLRATPSSRRVTINLKSQLARLTGKKIPIPLPSFSLKNIAATGQFDLVKGGLATIVISGSIGRNNVHAIFQKPLKSGRFTGAFAAEFGPIRLADIIRKTTRVDVSRVPFFGTLTIPRLGVTVSSEYITSSLLPVVFCKEGLLQNTGVTIPKGLQVFFSMHLKGSRVPVKMSKFKSFMTFEVIGKRGLPIGALLSTIPGVNLRRIPLPSGVRNVLKMQVVYFSLDTNSKELVLDSNFPGTLKFFKGKLAITNPTMKITAILKRPRKLAVEVDGAIKIGKQEHEITITRDPTTKKFLLRASFKTIPISDIIHKFSAKVLPRAFQRILKKFIQFSIHNAKLVFPLGTKNLQLHLSGIPVIGRYKTVHMSAVMIQQGGKTHLIEGFQFGKVSLASLLYKITRKNLRRIAILNQELDTSIIISPVTLPGVHLHGRMLKDISIVKGVSLHATLKWPSNCARDKLCAIAQRKLGRNARLSLQASIQSSSSFMLSAGVSNFKLGRGVVLQRAALQIRVGKENSYGIEGTIHLRKYGIILSAGLRVGTRGLVLQGNMQGCWKRAFGIKWVTICNLHLLIAVQGALGALEIGGEVRIGNPSCLSHPLTALGYFGVDQLNVDNNFYYVQLKNKITMGTALQAFCIRFRLPRPLADSGFPNGFMSSYSPIGKKLPKAGIEIPAGFRLKGTINILGLVAHADVTLSLPKGIYMKMALSPLRVGGGLLQMYASSSDRSRGPFLIVNIDPPKKKTEIHASGFVSVLGIQAGAMLRISDKEYEYMIHGKILHLFQARLHITAKYGNIKQAGFRVRGYLRNDLFAFIRNKIKKGLQSASQDARKAIDNAKRKVNSQKAKFDNANSKLDDAKRRIDKARQVFNRAKGILDGWQRKFDHLCRKRHCGSIRVCHPCRKGSHCRKVWRSRICVPKFGTCCKHVRNRACDAFNWGCDKARRAVTKSLGIAKRGFDQSKHIFNAAKAILSGAQRVVSISKRSLDIANNFLEAMYKVHQAGVKSISVLTSFATKGMFDIRRMSFDVALSTAGTGHFKVSITTSLLGKIKKFSIAINLKDITSFAKKIGERMIHGLKKFIH